MPAKSLPPTSSARASSRGGWPRTWYWRLLSVPSSSFPGSSSSPAPPSTTATATAARLIICKICLDAHSIALVARRHGSTVHVNRVCLEIELATEYDEFLSEAVRLTTGVVCALKVSLQCLIILETAAQDPFSNWEDRRGDEDVLLIADFQAFADKTLLVALTHMRVDLVCAEEAFAAELAQRMDAALNL